MRILLIVPNRESYSILSGPDIGIAYIARSILNAGVSVEILDLHKDNIGYVEFKKVISSNNYDLVGFKCLSMDVYKVLEYCRIVKDINKNIVTVIGGPHPTALPEHLLESSNVDYIIRGEGERGIVSLLKQLDYYNGKIPYEELQKIPCLGYRNNDKININPMVFETNLDDLGFPAWHLFKIEDYPRLPGSGGKFLPIITTRGCPSNCTFCINHSMHEKVIRSRSPEHVIEEVKWILKEFKLDKVSFYDNNFTYHKEHVMTISELYMKNKFPVKFDIPQGIKMDRIDEEIVKTLNKAGCTSIGIGVESGLQKTLEILKKGTTIKMIEEKVKMIKDNSNIEILGFFILGFPHETEEMILKTIEFATKLPIDYAGFTLFTPFPGTPLFDQMIKEGYFTLKDLNWSDLQLDRATFKHKYVSMDKLKKLQRKAYLRFYFRPSRFRFFMRILFKEASFMSYLRRFISILKR